MKEEIDQRKILFIDMDTLFSSLIQSSVLDLDKEDSFNLEIIMPLQSLDNLFTTLSRLFASISNNSVIILDSLNGLIDYINIYQNSTINGLDRVKQIKKSAKHKVGGYKSINILFLLLKRTQYKKIPIVITVFQKKETSEKIQTKLMTDDQSLEFNHLIRISNRIFFLEDINDCCNGVGNMKTMFTVFDNGNLKTEGGGFYPRSLCC
ncbi:MAG: hypothetical protein M3162_00165 [Thermoproteota archaeon]|nr:hypothetical protein [Thermoproteota archaeon]